MKDVLLGSDGDMVLIPSTGNIQTVTDQDQLKQKIQLALATNTLELEWNPDFGLPHGEVIDNLYDQSYVQQLIDDYLTEMFEEVSDVTIEDFVEDGERHMTIYLTVELESGETLNMNATLGGDEDALI